MKRALIFAATAAIAAAAAAQEPKPDVDAGAVLLVALKHFDGSPYHRTVVLAAPRGNGWHYAGAIAWGPFRLREQIKNGELAVLPVDEKLLFLEDTSKLYEELARRAGAIGTGLQVRF